MSKIPKAIIKITTVGDIDTINITFSPTINLKDGGYNPTCHHVACKMIELYGEFRKNQGDKPIVSATVKKNE